MSRTAERGNLPSLSAALEECLGILSILERTQADRADSLSQRPRGQYVTLYLNGYKILR